MEGTGEFGGSRGGGHREVSCLGVAVDGGAEARLLEADVALDPAELRLASHAVPARRHGFGFPSPPDTDSSSREEGGSVTPSASNQTRKDVVLVVFKILQNPYYHTTRVVTNFFKYSFAFVQKQKLTLRSQNNFKFNSTI